MKRNISVLLAFCFLLQLSVPVCLAEPSEQTVPENLLGQIYTTTNSTEILKRHKSVLLEENGTDYHLTYYADASIAVKDWRKDKGYMRIRTDAFDECLFDSGMISRYVSFETDTCQYSEMSESMLFETITHVENKDGFLIVTAVPSEAEQERLRAQDYADCEDRDKIRFRVEYTLFSDTLDVQSIVDYDTLPDGAEVIPWELHLQYNVECPYTEQIQTVSDHLLAADKFRTTTFCFDDGTAINYSCTVTIPVGDICAIPQFIRKDGILYEINREKSILTNEAKDNDAVIYLERSETAANSADPLTP